MDSIEFDYTNVSRFIEDEEIVLQREIGEKVFSSLLKGEVKGSEFLGWLEQPSRVTAEEQQQMEQAAEALNNRTEVTVVIGIGGSYLGAKSVIEALAGTFDTRKIIFAGHHLSSDYYYDLGEYLKDKEFGICVVSKSGTTTETVVAFRLLRKILEQQKGKEEARRRVVVITDKEKGELIKLAKSEGYATFFIPEDVGGRFSVLTPVALFPIALAGFDIRAFVEGALYMQKELLQNRGAKALDYAAVRNALYRKGYTIEMMVNYHPKLLHLSEWWKQLYGESEGKEHEGIFPAAVSFTTDLHSMGQFIQEGPRNLFETVVSIEKEAHPMVVPEEEHGLDKFDFLTGKRIEEINKIAEQGTCLAHVGGGVPNTRIILPELSEYYLGQLYYFFELACALSAGILGMNAFDQPGVEAYKREMFRLLRHDRQEENT